MSLVVGRKGTTDTLKSINKITKNTTKSLVLISPYHDIMQLLLCCSAVVRSYYHPNLVGTQKIPSLVDFLQPRNEIIQLRTAFFWVNTQQAMVIPHQYFRTT